MSVGIQYRPLTTVQYTVVSPRVWFWVKKVKIINSRVHTYTENRTRYLHNNNIITIESSLQSWLISRGKKVYEDGVSPTTVDYTAWYSLLLSSTIVLDLAALWKNNSIPNEKQNETKRNKQPHNNSNKYILILLYCKIASCRNRSRSWILIRVHGAPVYYSIIVNDVQL